jgi:hypothetical protein
MRANIEPGFGVAGSNQLEEEQELKYWGYFVAKILVAYVALDRLGRWIYSLIPEPEPLLQYRLARFAGDLLGTGVMLLFFLFCSGVLYLVIWDQRRRCRTCLRRLRMPVQRGHWGLATLLSPVRSESICPYGHGTLAEPDVRTTSTQQVQWREHSENIWRELESYDKK